MENGKKEVDYITKNILFQFAVCTVLFLLLFFLYKSDSALFKNIKADLSPRIEENLSADNAKEAFKELTDAFKYKIQTVFFDITDSDNILKTDEKAVVNGDLHKKESNISEEAAEKVSS